MSAPHVSWAFRVRGLKPAQRLVLMAIAERANGDLACWPSISVIADDCELTRRAVFLAIDYLENERQLIRKVTGDERDALLRRGGFKGDPRVNVYQIVKTEVPDVGEQSSPINGYDGEHSIPRSVNSVHPPLVNSVHPLGELSSPESPIESPREKRTPPPCPPPQVGRGVLAGKKQINADEETLAWAEREGVADAVAEIEAAIADKVANGGYRRATDAQALIRQQLRRVQQQRARPQRRDSLDVIRERLLAELDEPMGSA